jgi:hypothetical protein
VLRFIPTVARDRPAMSGSSLVPFFQSAKRELASIRNIRNMRFEERYAEIVTHRLNCARELVVSGIDARVAESVRCITRADMRSKSPEDIARSLNDEFQRRFTAAVQETMPNDFDSQRPVAQECRLHIEKLVRERVDTEYLNRCHNEFVKPGVRQAIAVGEREIGDERARISPQDAMGHSWALCANRIRTVAVTFLRNELNGLSQRLFQQPQYVQEETELSGTIATKVRDLENQKKADYRTWEANEIKRKAEEQERRKQAELARMQEEARRRQEEQERLAAQLLWQKQEQIKKQREQQEAQRKEIYSQLQRRSQAAGILFTVSGR